MRIFGFPISKTATKDEPDLGERFWYWRGASGRKYIHSVYAPDGCPPLPGAVYVGVKRSGVMRIALEVGRFGAMGVQMPSFRNCDEVHVHLLARGADGAAQVARDLVLALRESGADGLSEDQAVYLAA